MQQTSTAGKLANSGATNTNIDPRVTAKLLSVTREELEKLVQFLHDGKIHCENEDESLKILKDLRNLFGFSVQKVGQGLFARSSFLPFLILVSTPHVAR